MRGHRRPRAPRRPRLALAAAALLLLAGCWDRREIEERATALAAGVDLCAPGEGCRYRWTRQFAIPGRIPLGPSVGGGAAADPGEAVVVLSTVGATPFETAENVSARLHRAPFFGHVRVFVIGEELARRTGVAEILDYLQRHPDTRRQLRIVVSREPAARVIASTPRLDVAPALYLDALLEDAFRTGRLGNVTLADFLTRLSNRGEDPVAPYLAVEDGGYRLAGLAIFREDRMVGVLNEEQLEPLQHLRGPRRGAYHVRVTLPGNGPSRWADVAFTTRAVRVTPTVDRGRLRFRVHLDLEGYVPDVGPGVRVDDPGELRTAEDAAAAAVERRANALIARLQRELRADPLGFGEWVRALLPGTWAEIGDWYAVWPTAQVDVEAHVKIRRFGMSLW